MSNATATIHCSRCGIERIINCTHDSNLCADCRAVEYDLVCIEIEQLDAAGWSSADISQAVGLSTSALRKRLWDWRRREADVA